MQICAAPAIPLQAPRGDRDITLRSLCWEPAQEATASQRSPKHDPKTCTLCAGNTSSQILCWWSLMGFICMAPISPEMWRRVDTLHVCHPPPINVGDWDSGFADHEVPAFLWVFRGAFFFYLQRVGCMAALSLWALPSCLWGCSVL